jgi:hypothetical protein
LELPLSLLDPLIVNRFGFSKRRDDIASERDESPHFPIAPLREHAPSVPEPIPTFACEAAVTSIGATGNLPRAPHIPVIAGHSDFVGAGDREIRVLPPARLWSAIMADNPKTPMTRAEYDAQIMQHSLEALEKSYRLLKETGDLLTSQHPQVGRPGSDQEPDRVPERSRGQE